MLNVLNRVVTILALLGLVACAAWWPSASTSPPPFGTERRLRWMRFLLPKR